VKCVFKSRNCAKCVCSRGFAPDPVKLAYNTTPDPLGAFVGRGRRKMA